MPVTPVRVQTLAKGGFNEQNEPLGRRNLIAWGNHGDMLRHERKLCTVPVSCMFGAPQQGLTPMRWRN